MGLIIALLFGAVLGGAIRFALPRSMPRRLDVAALLAAVGGALGVLAGAIVGAPWVRHASTGSTLAAFTGTAAMLLAYALIPRATPELMGALPGRDPGEGR